MVISYKKLIFIKYLIMKKIFIKDYDIKKFFILISKKLNIPKKEIDNLAN